MSSKPANVDGSKPPCALTPGVAEAIVGRALLRIREHRVGLGGLLELLLGVLAALIAVGMVLERQLAVRGLQLRVRCATLDAEDFVVIALASRRRHLHHRRSKQAFAQPVAAAELLDDLALPVVGAGFGGDGLVQVRVERRAGRFDRRHAAPREQLEQLLVNQLDAAPVGLGAFAGGLGAASARSRSSMIGRRSRRTLSAARSAISFRSRSTRLR